MQNYILHTLETNTKQKKQNRNSHLKALYILGSSVVILLEQALRDNGEKNGVKCKAEREFDQQLPVDFQRNNCLLPSAYLMNFTYIVSTFQRNLSCFSSL